MTRSDSKIRFKAKLLRPAKPRNASWLFLLVPKRASSKLPTRGMTSVEGTINETPFVATFEPDGQGSHWLKVTSKMREAACAEAGDTVLLEIAPATKEPEPRVPTDLRKALAVEPEAKAVWSEITAVARRDWIQWIVTAKRSETRSRRIDSMCDMLASGKRRVCCFDRSGIYDGGISAPEAAD